MIRSRKTAAMMAMVLAASLVLSACGAKETGTPKTGETPSTNTGAKKPAVGGELVMRMDKDPDNFNPILSSTSYGSMVYAQVYATLFEFNTKWEPTPYVAKEWSASPDGLTWTIKLNEGIKFHDGADLTADDVVFTLMSIKTEGYTGPRGASMKSVKNVTNPDKYTVVIELSEPFAPIFTNINYGILQKKLFEGTKVADMATHAVTMNPVGAGPYKFVEYKRGQYVLLERNENWHMSKQHGGAPFIKNLRMMVIPEAATAQAALENGELDLMTPEPMNVKNLLDNFKTKLAPVDYERNGWGYMTFNTTRPHLDNKLVRQALTYGLDRKSVIDAVMDGRAVVPAGPVPTVSWAYDSSIKPFPYDKAKAKQLIEQAGYTLNAQGIYEKPGVGPLKLTFYGSAGSTLIEGLSNIARNNWKEIGVDLTIEMMDFNAMMENHLKPGKFDVSFSGFSLGLDPDQFSLFHSTQVGGFNRGRYNSPEVDRLLEAGRKETDPAKRKAIYSDYQKILVDDAPVLLVYSNQYTDFVSTKLKGVVNFPGVGASYIYRWYINEQ